MGVEEKGEGLCSRPCWLKNYFRFRIPENTRVFETYDRNKMLKMINDQRSVSRIPYLE